MQPGEYIIKDRKFINWNKIKCAICSSVYYWFGNVSVDKLYNRIIKSWPLEKWKIKELVEPPLNIQDAMRDWKLTDVSCGKISSGKLLNVNFEEVICIYASLKKNDYPLDVQFNKPSSW